MQAKRRVYQAASAEVLPNEDGPSRYWGIVVVAACTASWAAIIAAAKLLIALI